MLDFLGFKFRVNILNLCLISFEHYFFFNSDKTYCASEKIPQAKIREAWNPDIFTGLYQVLEIYLVNLQTKWKIAQIFVAFSELLNFNNDFDG